MGRHMMTGAGERRRFSGDSRRSCYGSSADPYCSGRGWEADNLACQAEAEGRWRDRVFRERGSCAGRDPTPGLVLMDTRLRGDGGSPAAVKNLQTRCNVPWCWSPLPMWMSRPCGETPQSRMGFWPGRLAPGSSGRWSKRRSTGIPESRVSAGPAVVKDVHQPAVRKIAHDVNNSLSSALANIQFPQVVSP